MSTHTPGPWRVEESSHKQEFSHWIGSLSTHVMPRQSTVAGVVNAGAESDANARLIAAAPDLLVACRAVLGHLDGSSGEIDAVHVLQLVIAKAEGRPA